MRVRTRMAFLLASAILVFPGGLRAYAATLSATPSLSLEESWDSNVFNAPDQEESDFVFRAIPRLTLSLGTSYTTVSLTGGYELEKYSDHSELDSNSATKDINLTASGPIQVSPRFSILPSALYVESEDLTRRNRFTQAPVPVLSPSDVVVTERTKSRDTRAALLMTYRISPTTDVSAGGGFARRDFTSIPPGSDLEDSRTTSGDASISHRFTPRFSSGLFFNTSYVSYDTSPDTRTYSSGLTADYTISDFLVLNTRGGASYLVEAAQATTPKNEKWLPYGGMTLRYSRRDFRATLDGNYSASSGGTFGQSTKNTTVALSLADRFAPHWEWELSGYFQNSRSSVKPVTQDITTLSGSAGIRYRPVQWASIGLRGDIFRQDSRNALGIDIDRKSAVVDVTLSKLYKLY